MEVQTGMNNTARQDVSRTLVFCAGVMCVRDVEERRCWYTSMISELCSLASPLRS